MTVWSTLPTHSFPATFVPSVPAVCSIGGIVLFCRGRSSLADCSCRRSGVWLLGRLSTSRLAGWIEISTMSQTIDPITHSAYPPIGQTGNLPRNAGRGPGLFMLDLNVSKEIRVSERLRIRPSVEFDNVLNKTVFSFGSEFIDPSSKPQRTMRPREIRIGIKISRG